jgi:2-methylcitrate dehydratase PrpD
MDGVRSLRARHSIAPGDVAALHIGLYSVGVNGHDHKHCENLLDAQMSAPVGAALALVDGDVAAHLFLPESLARPEVQRLIASAETAVDPECERIYPGRRSGAVEIRMKDGRKFSERVLDPRGEGENPMTDADLEQKFFTNGEPVIGKERARALKDAVWQFDQAPDLGALMRCL